MTCFVFSLSTLILLQNIIKVSFKKVSVMDRNQLSIFRKEINFIWKAMFQGEGKGREGDLNIHCFTLQTAVTMKMRPIRSWELYPGHLWWQGLKNVDNLGCFPRHFIRELDLEWSSQDTSELDLEWSSRDTSWDTYGNQASQLYTLVHSFGPGKFLCLL